MAKIIKLIDAQPAIVDDDWIVKRDVETGIAQESDNLIFPFAQIKDIAVHDWESLKIEAAWISPDDDFEPLAESLCQLSLIAVDFPSFRDGRGYSVAYLLRSRYGWKGELRAIGDVLRDQLNYMRRCGFDSFAVRADKNIVDAIKSFNRYSIQYQGAVDQPLPLFRRRHAG